ncbi:hypothetical protein [Burkholderia sp. 8Y]|uniref:hypothetical protein n=1 Tax=Burkholderia sp. 8Y TaxID=2653133 RepID=UPI001F196A1E|nr:hypothetical protein [Burkholderia sp. 8Y]
MQPDTLLKCVRSALHEANLSAADESPRLLRNTFGRRHLIAGKSNEQVSSLMGLSSHRTAMRLRQTIVPTQAEIRSNDRERPERTSTQAAGVPLVRPIAL